MLSWLAQLLLLPVRLWSLLVQLLLLAVQSLLLAVQSLWSAVQLFLLFAVEAAQLWVLLWLSLMGLLWWWLKLLKLKS